MKKITKITGALVLSAGLIFTGCSNNETPESKQSNTEAAQQEESAAIKESINNYYNSMVEKSPEAMEASSDVESVIREVAGDETYEAFSSTNNPFEGFDNISDDQAKELADRLQEINPIADQFDYSKLGDRDRAILNLLNIASSIILTGTQGKTIEIAIPDESIVIEGNKATVPYDTMVFKIDDDEQPMADVLGGNTIALIKVDNVWKLDGKQIYETTRENALNAQTPESSDNGEG